MGRGQVSGSGDQGDSVSDNIEVSTLGNGVDGFLEANISASGDCGISVSGNEWGFPNAMGKVSETGNDGMSQCANDSTSPSGDSQLSQTAMTSPTLNSSQCPTPQSDNNPYLATFQRSGDSQFSQTVDSMTSPTGTINSSQCPTPQSNNNPSQPTFPRGRKRKRDPENWKRNISKRRCNSGEAYVNKKGEHKPAKVMKKACGFKCRSKCSGMYTNEDREKYFTHSGNFLILTNKGNLLQNSLSKGPRKVKLAKQTDANHQLVGFCQAQMNKPKRLRFVKHSF